MSKAQSNQFKTVNSKLIYQARLYHLDSVTMRAPDGHEFRHEVIYHPGAAVIIPVLPDERFVLVKQFRTAVKKTILEFPAGTLEKGEQPIECAKREIIEETGYSAKNWKKLVSFYPAPGISTEVMHIFLASSLSPAKMHLDQDEYIERKIVSFRDLQKLILNGTIVDAKTIVGFFYYTQMKRKKGK